MMMRTSSVYPMSPRFSANPKRQKQAKPQEAQTQQTTVPTDGESKTQTHETTDRFFTPHPIPMGKQKPLNFFQKLIRSIQKRFKPMPALSLRDRQLWDLFTNIEGDLKSGHIHTGGPPKVHHFKIRRFKDSNTLYYQIRDDLLEEVTPARIEPTEFYLNNQLFTLEKRNNKHWELDKEKDKWKDPVYRHFYTLKGNDITLTINCEQKTVEYKDDKLGVQLESVNTDVYKRAVDLMEKLVGFIKEQAEVYKKPLTAEEGKLRY